jgi:hypothetical protein
MSKNNLLKNRKPIRRQGVEAYLIITLLSFATSVSLTRLFLELTGYPKIGSGELHIAHVLWGGLLLFVASLIMLIFGNRWVYLLGSLITGIGVGLFIDEVGKFITQNNDYFYPSAAPIIYAFFLMTVLVFVIIRKMDRRKPDARSMLYHILEDLNEVLDHDLSEEEKDIILHKLDIVIDQANHQDLVHLATQIKVFITQDHPYLIIETPHFWERSFLKFKELETKWITRLKLKMLIMICLTFVGVRMIVYPFFILSLINNPNELSSILMRLFNEHLVKNSGGLTWFQARVGLEGSIGIILLMVVFLLLIRREKQGILLGHVALIFSLTIVNLLIFYFNQFSVIANAIIQFFILLLLMRYRYRFMKI